MILSCERCDAQYTVGDDSIGDSGRKVRCTSCGYVWLQKPDFGKAERANPLVSGEFAAAEPTPRKPKPAAKAAPADAPTAASAAPEAEAAQTVRRFSAPSRKPAAAPAPKESGRVRKQMIRIAALVLPSAALAAGLIVFRDPLITFWPPIARLYSTIGLPVSATTPDLAVRAVKLEEKNADGHHTLLIDGEIANLGTGPLALPRLHATLGEGDTKARWSFKAGSGILDPGASVPFHTELADPPAGARSVSVGVWR